MTQRQGPYPDQKLEALQRLTLDYFLKEANPENGLVPDSTRRGAACSIAATGFALAAYIVGVERGFISRQDAIKRTITTLRFFWNSPQSRGTGRHRIQRFLLSLPGHEDRPAGGEL